MKKLLLFLSLALTNLAVASERRILFEQNFIVSTGFDYETGFIKIRPGNLDLQSFEVTQAGSYCFLSINSVHYQGSDYKLKRAKFDLTTKTFAVEKNDQVRFINISFKQSNYDNAPCRVKVFGNTRDATEDHPDEDDNEGDRSKEELVGAFTYTGGFQKNLSIAFDARDGIKEIRVEIPEFCQGAKVLEIGTVVDGVFYKATLNQNKTYTTSILGEDQVTQIRAALNGPKDKNCDIPVYLK